MDARQSIYECLVSCRNILLTGRSNERVVTCLESVLANVDSINILMTRTIMSYCVSEAIAQARNSDLISAGHILNLIHNLPLDEEGRRRWDIDYFLSMELSGFLDHFEEIKSARSIVLYVCGQVAKEEVGL